MTVEATRSQIKLRDDLYAEDMNLSRGFFLLQTGWACFCLCLSVKSSLPCGCDAEFHNILWRVALDLQLVLKMINL